MTLIVETDRLYLRIWDPDDAKRLFEICSDAEVMHHIGTRIPYQSIDDARGFIEWAIGSQKESGYSRWAVVLKDDQTIVGSCGFARLRESGEIELGYLFAREVWGKGIATEAAGACLQHGFEKLRFEQVVGLTDPDHVASQRVLEKIGFVLRGIERGDGEDDKVYVAKNPFIGRLVHAGNLSAS